MLYPPLILTSATEDGKIRVNPAVVAWYSPYVLNGGVLGAKVCVGSWVFLVVETPEQIAAMIAELCRLQDQRVFNIPGMGLEELRALRSARSAGRIEVVERPEGDKPDYGF